MQRDTVEHNDFDAPCEQQSRDGVKGVELGSSCGYFRQVPTEWRRQGSHSAFAIERATAHEHTADRSDRWRRRSAALEQRTVDGCSTMLPEVAALTELRTHAQNRGFDIR